LQSIRPFCSFIDRWDYINYNEKEYSCDLTYLKNTYSIASDGKNNFRTGCWVCTLVKRDRSLEKLSERDSSLKKYVYFRKYLLGIRDDKEKRMEVTRNGETYKGPLNYETRKEIYKKADKEGFLNTQVKKAIQDNWKAIFESP